MTVQRVPIGVRLGISHYWELPFYKLKHVAFSYALLKYLRLLVVTFFMSLKENWIKFRYGSVRLQEFFIKLTFHFWESQKLNVFITIISKLKLINRSRISFSQYLKIKTRLESRFLKLRLINAKHTSAYYYRGLNKIRYGRIEKSQPNLKVVGRIYQTRGYDLSQGYHSTYLKWLLRAMKQFKSSQGLYSLQSKRKKFFFFNYITTLRLTKSHQASSPLHVKAELVILLDACIGLVNYSSTKIKTVLSSGLLRYLSDLFHFTGVYIYLNIGWPLLRYLYFCYILYHCYFKRFAAEKNLSRYYRFYSRAVLGFYLKELTVIFNYFHQKFIYRRFTNMRFTNKFFFNFVKKLKILPYKYFGISTVNIQFKGRAWAKKKKWAKTKKVSILDPANPLSTFKINYRYIAYNINTKFGTYGIKLWMTFSEDDFNTGLAEFLTTDISKDPGQVKFVTKEISWVNI